MGAIKNFSEFVNESNTAERRAKQKLTRALLNAVWKGDKDLCRRLISDGVDINAKSMSKTGNGESALHAAAAKGSINMVNFLLSLGADPNIKDKNGSTPLNMVVATGKLWAVEIARILLRNGADPNDRDLRGCTPLSSLCKWNRYSSDPAVLTLIDILLDSGSEIDTEDVEGNTPLKLSLTGYNHYTDGPINTVIARRLIERGAYPFKAFDGADDLIRYFGGDVSWLPEGPGKTKLQRLQRGKSAFGM